MDDHTSPAPNRDEDPVTSPAPNRDEDPVVIATLDLDAAIRAVLLNGRRAGSITLNIVGGRVLTVYAHDVDPDQWPEQSWRVHRDGPGTYRSATVAVAGSPTIHLFGDGDGEAA